MLKFLQRYIFIAAIIIAVFLSVLELIYTIKGQNSHFFGKIHGMYNEHTDNKERKTKLSDLYVSVKTTKSNDKKLQVLMETWIPQAKEETFIVTDAGHLVPYNFSDDQFIVTNCSTGHDRKGLCCKMGVEYTTFMKTNKRWFCHMDDDTYVNVPLLVLLLQNYTYTEDWYIGSPSLTHPMKIRIKNRYEEFWFAHGGCGFCISRGLTEKMIPYARGRQFEKMCSITGVSDDCTIGYIINNLLKVSLTKKLFRHEYEGNIHIPASQLPNQVTISRSIEIQGYSPSVDPTRFRTIHCHLYPNLKQCEDMPTIMI